MDYVIYILAAGVTLAWSVWSYLFWEKQKELPGEGLLRSWFMVAPSVWFIAVASAGWGDFFLRLDLIGLGALIVVHLLSSAALGLLVWLKQGSKRNYFIVMAANSAVALVWALFLHAAKNYPPLTVQLAVFTEFLQDPDSFFYHLVAVSAVGKDAEVTTLFDKLLIAILSIVPFAALRMILLNLRLAKLNKRIAALEEKLAHRGQEIQNSKDTV